MPTADQFRVIIRSLEPSNLPTDAKYKIALSAQFFESAFRSDYFRERVVNFGSSSKGFSHAFGRSNSEIYERLVRAKENTGNVELYTADLYLKFLPGSGPGNGEIGFVNPNTRTINTYRAYLDAMNVGRLAAHFAHEWTHVMGYAHPEYLHEYEESLLKTIPYAIQKIVMDYADFRLRDFMLHSMNEL